MTREYRLAVKHITKSFKNEKILEDVNLDFSGGHIYGIIGKNGTGKSVLFKMICGFIHADEGEIEINGKKIGKDIDCLLYNLTLPTTADTCSSRWAPSP